MIEGFDQRTRDIFRGIVENYLASGEPVGSRTLSRMLGIDLSPASIRNVMADLEEAGLLYAPHTSAGRLPTEKGLRLFVDGLLEVGNLSQEEQEQFRAQCRAEGRSYDSVLRDAIGLLSGLTKGAGLVVAPKMNAPLRHIEFVSLNPGRALVVMVTEDGQVENRVMSVPKEILPSALERAGNYLNARLAGRTLDEARFVIEDELEQHKTELDELTARVVEAGLAVWSSEAPGNQTLIVRGHANLLEEATAKEDLGRIRKLLDDLENKTDFIHLLDLARDADGVRVFIGSENNLFSLSGSSLVLAPYGDENRNLVGAVGVIGPTRMNYARIVPMVDYTAKLIGEILR
jgi:heat-inducible transcriptional repressor